MLKNDTVENITVVMLKVKNENYLFEVSKVKEIYVPGDKIIPVPLADKTIVGIIDIRKQIYSIISLKQLIYKNGTAYEINDKSRIILTEIDGLNIGILVDSVVGVRQIPISIFDLNNAIVETNIDYQFIKSIGIIDDETVILLDLSTLISPFIISRAYQSTPELEYPKTKATNKSPKLSYDNKIEELPINRQSSIIRTSKHNAPKRKVRAQEDRVVLSAAQQDLLKEMGNIGCGNAVTALSRLIKKKVDVNLTDVGIISFDQLTKQFGNPNERVGGIFCHIDKPSKSTILQIFDMKPLLKLVATLNGKKLTKDPSKVKSKKDLSKEEISAIVEMGNIMAGHYATALGDLTGIKMMIDIPEFAMTTAGSLGKFLTSELQSISKFVLIIKTSVNIVDYELNGVFFFIPDIEALNIFFKKLNLSPVLSEIPEEDKLLDINLTENQKDALMEVGNIGAGNAANALAKMINKRVDINIPAVELVELDVFADEITSKNEKLLVAWSNVTGKTRATVLTIFTIKDILRLTSILVEEDQKKISANSIKSVNDFPEIYRSAISELGHILASHYTSALGDLLSIRLMTEAPDMSVDVGRQLFRILKDEIGLLKKLSLVITTNVLIKDIKIKGTFLFIPNIEKLHELLDALSQFYD